MNKILIPFLSLLLIASVSFGFWSSNRTATARSEADAMQAKLDEQTREIVEIKAKLQQAQKKNDFLTQSEEAIRQKLEEARASTANAAAPATEDNKNDGKGLQSSVLKMMKVPAFKKGVAAKIALMTSEKAAKMAAKLGLNPDQTRQLTDLLVTQATKALDNMDDLLDPAKRAAMASQMAQAATEQEAQIKALLGDQAYTQYQALKKTEIVQPDVDSLRTTLAASQTPLQQTQENQLLQVMMEENGKTGAQTPAITDPTDMKANMAAITARMADVNQRVLDRAQTFLTSDQLAALKDQQTTKLEMIKASAAFSSQFFPQTAPAPANAANAAPANPAPAEP